MQEKLLRHRTSEELQHNSHVQLPIPDLFLLGPLTLSSATTVRLEVRGAVPHPINPVKKTYLVAFATRRDPTGAVLPMLSYSGLFCLRQGGKKG